MRATGPARRPGSSLVGRGLPWRPAAVDTVDVAVGAHRAGLHQPVLVANGGSDRMAPATQNSADLARRLPKPSSVTALLRSAKVRAAVTGLSGQVPGSHREPDSDGRSLVIAVAREASGRPPATTAHRARSVRDDGVPPDWGAVHAAAPDAVLKPGVHGPIAAFGLDTLTLGAADAGVHEVAGASARLRQLPPGHRSRHRDAEANVQVTAPEAVDHVVPPSPVGVC